MLRKTMTRSVLLLGPLSLILSATACYSYEADTASCALRASCAECVSAAACGWCGSEGRCVPGNRAGPVGGSCSGGWAFLALNCSGSGPEPRPTCGASTCGSSELCVNWTTVGERCGLACRQDYQCGSGCCADLVSGSRACSPTTDRTQYQCNP